MMQSNDQDGVLNDPNQWKLEARAVINDVRDHVRELRVCVAPGIQNSNSKIHLNLTTLEGNELCVRLTTAGFSVVGDRHDCVNSEEAVGQCYETIYALLSAISPSYTQSFGNSLLDKLQRVADNQ
ncbi:hypothetical protein TKK_0006622 [Trichogramma kaykai]|uniref:GSKIP domain-containing protein n=1 Tax=Trichogramma kaykai TaxID=54128 RepID=A0ABD2XDK7_9HYME